jgi:hypothetical protein
MGAWLEYLNELETPVCLAWNRSTERRWVREPFALVSVDPIVPGRRP